MPRLQKQEPVIDTQEKDIKITLLFLEIAFWQFRVELKCLVDNRCGDEGLKIKEQVREQVKVIFEMQRRMGVMQSTILCLPMQEMRDAFTVLKVLEIDMEPLVSYAEEAIKKKRLFGYSDEMIQEYIVDTAKEIFAKNEAELTRGQALVLTVKSYLGREESIDIDKLRSLRLERDTFQIKDMLTRGEKNIFEYLLDKGEKTEDYFTYVQISENAKVSEATIRSMKRKLEKKKVLQMKARGGMRLHRRFFASE